MTDDDQEHRRPPLDEPTVMGSISGDLGQAPAAPQQDDPTLTERDLGENEATAVQPGAGGVEPSLPEPGLTDEPTIAQPTANGDEPTLTTGTNEPTLENEAITAQPTASGDEPTLSEPGLGNGPTIAQPTASDDEPTLAAGTDEATLPEPGLTDEPTIAQPTANGDEPTLTTGTDEPTIGNEAITAQPTTSGDEPTLSEPGLGNGPTIAQPTASDDEPTLAVGADEPTTTGPTVGTWPFDQFEAPPPDELIWRVEAPPAPAPAAARRPAYYAALGAAVVLVVGLVALAAFVSVVRPRQEVAGDAVGRGGVPEITSTSAAPPPVTSSTQAGAFAELAALPLSSSTARMPDATCSLPRFDPADDRQADFYTAAKVCADAAWRPLLAEAGLEGDITVVTLTGPAQTQTCGELEPTSPPTQCDGVVYLTPAYLRDTEQNGRYPGRYLGVFLREYARALQFANGVDELVDGSTAASGADLDTRVEQQATCLAGVTAGAMAGRGAIDSNITKEVRDRLSTVDASAGARDWLDKGFQQRTPAACNSWAD